MAAEREFTGSIGRRRLLKYTALAVTALGGSSLLACTSSVPSAPPTQAPPGGSAATPAPGGQAKAPGASGAPTSASAGPPAAAPAAPKPLVKGRWLGGAGNTLDVLFTPWTVPLALGMYRDEGLDFEFATLAGGTSTVQALTAGHAEFSNLTHPTLLPLMKGDKDFGIKVVYTWMRKFHAKIAVPPDSPIKEVKDLDGKKIGVVNMGDTGVFAGQAMMREVGLDPSKAELIAVGYGASALKGLESGQVDALSIWDVEFARQENLGAKYRYLPVPPRIAALPGSTVGVTGKYLVENRAAVVGALRGFTKGIVFAQTNPAAGVQLHWKVFPESKPKGISEEQALKEAIYLLESRLDKLRADDQPDKRWGYSDLAQVQTWIDVLGLKGEVTRPEQVFTNELVDEINRGLDLDRVREQARTFKA